MNPLVERTAIPSLVIAVSLACFALLPRAQAVIPPPDGGYPNFTTAEGDHALQALTSGLGNTAIGTFSLFSTTTGNFNTAVGAGALDFNTADSNTAVGVAALLLNTTGTENTAVGTAALESNDSADDNTAIGALTLQNNTIGINNTAVGGEALLSNSSGNGNTATGAAALISNSVGVANTADGFEALFNSTGNGNTAIGRAALFNTTGSGNTALGFNAGNALTTGDNNIDIGADVVGVAGEANTIRIGNASITSTFIRGISGSTAVGGAAVYVDSGGHLGTLTSSARFKQGIHSMDKTSEAILALNPVTFRYKEEIDPKGIPQFGLLAEEVEKVNPDLVVRDTEGKPYSVRYEAVNAMLLNEFLKEHKKTEKLEATVANLIATVKEQEAQIQKVSAQFAAASPSGGGLELSKSAPQMVNNP